MARRWRDLTFREKIAVVAAASLFQRGGLRHWSSEATTRVPLGPHTPSTPGLRLLEASA